MLGPPSALSWPLSCPSPIPATFNTHLVFSSATQSCLTHCDPMDCNIPGFPVHHLLPELPQAHVHPVGDAIQPSHPLSSPFLLLSILCYPLTCVSLKQLHLQSGVANTNDAFLKLWVIISQIHFTWVIKVVFFVCFGFFFKTPMPFKWHVFPKCFLRTWSQLHLVQAEPVQTG